MAGHIIGVDLAAVTDAEGEHRITLGWGDPVEVLEEGPERIRISLTDFRTTSDGSILPFTTEGFLAAKPGVLADPATERVLQLDFVDVQQGDAAMLQTPGGQVVLVDGGENQLFARYLAARYRGTSPERPKDVAAIVVTHGDADHFSGLTEIVDSERPELTARKRFFARPARVFHNGIVKRPSTLTESKQLGPTTKVGSTTLLTGLVDDLRDVPDADMNAPFKAWKKALRHFTERNPQLELRRLEAGDGDAFDFLRSEGIKVEVLGPIPVTLNGATGLPFLGRPSRALGERRGRPTGLSASHTINGHSVVLRLTYGRWRFLLAGDLNEQAEEFLTAAHGRRELSLRSEVFKVPHHGSADFQADFMKAVAPVVSVVSSGDENARKEYIHPRATLMSALGRYGREQGSVVFVTELVAFFNAEGFVLNKPPRSRGWARRRSAFFAFSRTAYGIVRVRTDGDRLLVYTDSGQADLKEAYAYTLDRGRAVPQEVRRA